MAILIPSKNIYDKQNPKVRDNVIERIEVGAVEVVPDNEYNTPVYNEEIYSAPSLLDVNKIEYKVYSKADNSASIYGYWIAFSKISVPKYYRLNYQIPKVFNNKYINKLYVGVDKEENPQIKYTIYYKKILYSSSMSATFFQNDKALGTYGTISKDEKETTDGNSSNFDFVRQYEYPYNPTIGIWGNTTTNKVLLSLQKSPNISNIRDENILDTSDENYYKISNLMILGEYEQSLLGGWDYGSIGYPESKTITLQGDTTKYTAQKIEITIYGNTIGIDLTDNTVYINGKTKKKVYSVEGNELMQTSNYYQSTDTNAITRAFTETQTDYAKGKETATIRCSISDYYNYEDKSIAINSNKKNLITYPYLFGKKQTLYGITATDLGNGSILLQGTSTLGNYIYFDLMKKKIEGIVANDLVASSAKNPCSKYGYTISMGDYNSEEYSGIAIGYTESNNITWLRIDPYKEINITIYPMLNKGGKIAFEYPATPMCFSIGDKVIPMVYGADGKDRPMSKNQDGSPKVFQVLGSKIYYDGAVWQELSLQEV